MSRDSASGPGTGLARRLGRFDATMLVMGGIIGAGIFVNPAEVARHVQSPALILGAWAVGGLVALVGAFVYAELAARRPDVGGQYAYLRDAYGPTAAFLYGWSLLLVIQSGAWRRLPSPSPAISARSLPFPGPTRRSRSRRSGC